MIGNTSASEILSDRDGTDRYGFLASHRALGACGREFTRLADQIVQQIKASPEAASTDVPVQRRTPERCIVQLGPVAITLAWLRSTPDTAADGRLLVIVWRGTVAQRLTPQLERPGAQSPRTATAVWETTLMADAASEAAWAWRPETPHGAEFGDAAPDRYSCEALATLCAERLIAALEECATVA
jgi:hypothetical protein